MKNIIIYTTCSNEEEAKKIAEHLVSQNLIACANIFPINSIYKWKGQVEKAQEVAMILKTREELFEQVKKEIKKLHSYKLPAIIYWEIGGDKSFLEWIGKETKG